MVWEIAIKHSWQRGINENSNGVLRQYRCKGTDIAKYSQRQLGHIAWILNTRTRKSLGFKTPAEVFFSKRLKMLAMRAEV